MSVYMEPIVCRSRSRRRSHYEPLPDPDQSLNRVWRITRSMRIDGELIGGLDISIDGDFSGKIVLHEHQLHTGAASRVHADVVAKNVVVRGEVVGNITAHDSVTILKTGVVLGEIWARRVKLVDGCTFSGRIITRPDGDTDH